MRVLHIQTVVLVIGLAFSTAAAQNSRSSTTSDDSGSVSVQLAAHNGRTRFKIGDPVILDLVFTAKAHGYAVDTNTTPYLPPVEIVNITPDKGWIRSHAVATMHGLNGNTLVTLGRGTVRVPILLNRSITFLQPGQYEVSVSTKRLLMPGDGYATLDCDTNSVVIDLASREESGETTLVESLVRELEMTNPDEPGGLPQRKMKELRSQSEALLRGRSLSSLSEAEKKALLQKLEALEKGYFSDMKARQTEHRATAIRLAYLPGDDALRAKVEIIAHSYDEVGEADSIAEIMVDGLPSSNNKRLQLALLEAAWRDPKNIPTEALQTAVREARELVNHETVTDQSIMWVGTRKHHDAVMKEYQREINELIATLPLRSEPNRAKTIKYIKSQGAPNQLNSRK